MPADDDGKKIEKVENEPEKTNAAEGSSGHRGGLSSFGMCEKCGGEVVPTQGGVVLYQCVKCGHMQTGHGPVIGGRGRSSW